ncbi:hypothetical protein EON79_20265 [bacterium]|nr:MAG: hypothetical protein EON79_20265 [bacterium]
MPRLRFFNGSSIPGLRLALNDVPLEATGTPTADFGQTVAYHTVPDGIASLSARTGLPGEASFATAPDIALTEGDRYTAYAAGSESHRTLFTARDTHYTDSGALSLYVQVVDALDGEGTHYAMVYRNEEWALSAIFDARAGTGFADLRAPYGLPTPIRYSVRLNTDGTGNTPIGERFVFDIDTRNPVTVVMYGSPHAPKFAVLKGTYLNLPSEVR